MKRLLLLIVPTVVLAIGCSNPKDANNENFGKAVSAYLMQQEEAGAYCIGSKVDHYQVQETSGPGSSTRGLLKIGFLKITSQQPTMMGFWKLTVYDLTAKGRESFIQGRGFCLGKPSLSQIVNFTDPGPTGSMSLVSYTYRLKDVPSWASGPAESEFRVDVPAAYGDVQSTGTLVLTGNGWVHESLAPH